MKALEQLQFNNTFSRLPAEFFSRLQTTPLAQQFLISFNPAAAELIELHAAEAKRDDFVDVITGSKILPGFEPLAACYSGHQFGHYVPRLGDGRAIPHDSIEIVRRDTRADCILQRAEMLGRVDAEIDNRRRARPLVQQTVLREGKPAGELRSVLELDAGWLGMGLLRREVEVGSTVDIAASSGTVVALPFNP